MQGRYLSKNSGNGGSNWEEWSTKTLALKKVEKLKCLGVGMCSYNKVTMQDNERTLINISPNLNPIEHKQVIELIKEYLQLTLLKSGQPIDQYQTKMK